MLKVTSNFSVSYQEEENRILTFATPLQTLKVIGTVEKQHFHFIKNWMTVNRPSRNLKISMIDIFHEPGETEWIDKNILIYGVLKMKKKNEPA